MNGMKAQILTATLFTAFSGVLPAADPTLLNLVMPDAKVLAGVNVQQAKGTQFGQYILNELQSHDAEMQKLVTLTGFDPRRDVIELLVASDGVPGGKTGLALAKGTFNVAMITAAATMAGVTTEAYGSFTILEEPNKQHAGIAFLDGSTVVAGDIASVKGAIDRLKTPQPLPSTVTTQVSQWTTQDAWGITTVPPASLAPPAKAGSQNNPMANVAQNVQSAGGGVKFGAQVVFSGQAQCDTAQNATTLGDMVKLLINMAQMQSGQDPTAAALIKSVTVTATGTLVNVSASLPEDVFQGILQSHKKTGMAVHKK